MYRHLPLWTYVTKTKCTSCDHIEYKCSKETFLRFSNLYCHHSLGKKVKGWNIFTWLQHGESLYFQLLFYISDPLVPIANFTIECIIKWKFRDMKGIQICNTYTYVVILIWLKNFFLYVFWNIFELQRIYTSLQSVTKYCQQMVAKETSRLIRTTFTINLVIYLRINLFVTRIPINWQS